MPQAGHNTEGLTLRKLLAGDTKAAGGADHLAGLWIGRFAGGAGNGFFLPCFV